MSSEVATLPHGTPIPSAWFQMSSLTDWTLVVGFSILNTSSSPTGVIAATIIVEPVMRGFMSANVTP